MASFHGPSGLHPFNRRLLAEELVRVRRSDDRERFAASQRQARIDPNPHQIDAVIFALRRRPGRVPGGPRGGGKRARGGASRRGAAVRLVVIDEAHEIFAGLHKRYGRDGVYDETSDEARMAHQQDVPPSS